MLAVILNVVASVGMLLQAGSACPPATWDSLLNDPAVQQAIKDLWASSKEGTSDEKEQGAHVYQCAGEAADGTTDWVTVVEPWPDDQATDDFIPIPTPNPGPGCRHSGMFHTHPGGKDEPVPGKPGWVDQNQKPSDTDIWNANFTWKVPNLIIFGEGPNWKSGDVTKFGWEAAQTPCPGDGSGSGSSEGVGDGSGSGSSGDSGTGSGGAPGAKGESSGDPHMLTFDGFSYDMMAAGEFVVVRSTTDDFQIQARQEPITDQSLVTGNSRVAVRLDGSTIDFSLDDIVVDGERRQMTGELELTTPGGGRVTGGPGDLVVTWSDGTELRFTGRSFVVSLAEKRRGDVEGLLGDADGEQDNDLFANGAFLLDDGLLLGEVYEDLAEEWRVNDENSLFSYEDGESSEDFSIEDFPRNFVALDMLEPEERAEAEARCRDGGLADPTRIANCALDFAVSEDESWIEEAVAVAAIAEDSPSPGGEPPEVDPELVEAAGRGDLAEVQRLLAEGANVGGVDEDGRSPLHWGVLAGDLEVVQVLLASGADPDQADGKGETALHVAAFWGFDEIVTALLDAGADRTIENNQGDTPGDLAAAQGHDDLAEQLE